MESKIKILNAVKFIGGTILAIGIIIFSIGLIENDYKLLTSFGIGTIMGSVFIFLIGVFFVASEEMVEKIYSQDK
ncbi:hypothetical protein [Cytobacillus firmus]|uniref:Uncharacterized protein n=1 Tax=Cytobacillus firmus TaxID=1399 RepID=A0AA46PGW5_CYTFI|nr:hypothetical protein [Cytobacillus firmus]UYG98073.1 hypothetical protein OD459_26690 [Cytobacillus firmus]